MYVELNHRRTGKTTRLVEHVKKELKAGTRCIVVGANQSSANRLILKICDTHEEYMKYKNNNKLSVISSYMVDDFRRGLADNCFWFWDEFTMCENVFWINNGYYCGTTLETAKQDMKNMEAKFEINRLLRRNFCLSK